MLVSEYCDGYNFSVYMNQNLSMNMAGAYHERVVLLFGIERVNENYKTSPFELFSSQKMPFYREDIW